MSGEKSSSHSKPLMFDQIDIYFNVPRVSGDRSPKFMRRAF